jgi:uncharacterized alpha-E superfamily protein
MLSRTAEHLFWLNRYIERAENTVRMLDMSHQTTMMPQSLQMAQRSWQATLDIFQLTHLFDKKYDLLNHQDVLHFMCFDADNPSSIFNSIKKAQENASAVRGSITNELFENINATWLEYQVWADKILTIQNYTHFYEWIKNRSNLYRGIQISTIFQDEIYHFLNLGTYLERADNIARLIDVKFYTLGIWLDDQKDISMQASSHADFYHWAIVLKAVSCFEIFRRLYSESITPEKIIDLLIFNADMPRSLIYSIKKVHYHLQPISNKNSKDTEKFVASIAANLEYNNNPKLLMNYLHQYLTDFLHQMQLITAKISDNFMLNSIRIYE